MKIWIICIGTEILRGRTLNTNLAFLGEQLGQAGYAVEREICIQDNPEDIFRTAAEAWQNADLVITVGGLGPTSDDLTKQVVCKVIERSLVLHEQTLAMINAFFAKRGVCANRASVEGQAMIPAGSVPLPNHNGTAPGIWFEDEGRVLVMLPGPPREFQPLVSESLLPRLQARCAADFAVIEMAACGVPESRAAEAVEEVLQAYPEVLPAYCAKYTQVDIRLTALVMDQQRLLAAAVAVRERFGDALLEPGEDSLAVSVLNLLARRGWTLAAAESCTGGGIGVMLTDVPGASSVFRGSVVTYANDWKQELLGVPESVISVHGAVSAETVTAMLAGLRDRLKVDAGLAVSGIAGPDGGSAAKPVGLVYVGSFAGSELQVERFVFPGNRGTVRARAAASALNQLRRQLLILNKCD